MNPTLIPTYAHIPANSHLVSDRKSIAKLSRTWLALVATTFGLMMASHLAAAAGAPDAGKVKKEDKTKPAGDKKVTIVIETSLGNIEAELNSEKAPISVANFLKYVDKKHYDGLIFHRVISGFMIQGGGMDEKMNEKKNDAPIKNEATNGLKNDRGTLAMARTSVVDSATSQFFINTVDNGFLNHSSPDPRGYGYAVFGKVTAGMDVVDKIRAVPTGNVKGMDDVPKTPVVIKSIRRK